MTFPSFISFLLVAFKPDISGALQSTMANNESYVVTTLTGGKGTNEPKDGDKGVASFTDDAGSMTIDGSGNLYINDDRSLRKVTPEGSVKTLFGQNIYDAGGAPKKVAPLKSAVNEGSIVDIVGLAYSQSQGALFISAEERA